MFKKYIILLMISLISLHIEAQDISSPEAFQIAQSFMSKKGITLVNDEIVSTRGNGACHIFKGEGGKGFAIVVNNAIVGYSLDNTIDISNIPTALRNILMYYSENITKSKTRGNDYPDWFTPREISPIKPLITTHWDQISPYNDLMEAKEGICVTVANGQLLHYFRVKECKEVYSVHYEMTLPYTKFNHDLILDRYDSSSTQESREEVAKLMHYAEKTIGDCDETDFETALGLKWELWTSRPDGYEVFKDAYYRYHKIYEGLIEDKYDFIDKYLEQRIPLRTDGSFGDDGHAFLIDGRDSNGMYHINWGWGGYYDGYFAIARWQDDGRNSSIFEEITEFIILKVNGWTSSINRIDYPSSDKGNVYNLQGLNVGNSPEALPKGIYIKDGKKIIVK